MNYPITKEIKPLKNKCAKCHTKESNYCGSCYGENGFSRYQAGYLQALKDVKQKLTLNQKDSNTIDDLKLAEETRVIW